jgi:hypothetical protein
MAIERQRFRYKVETNSGEQERCRHRWIFAVINEQEKFIIFL